MKEIITVLKSSPGIFYSAMNPKYSTREDIVYRSINEDKINIRNDMMMVFSDFKKSTNEALK